MSDWVAFLRGINVGGRTVRMIDLEEACRNSGFSDVSSFRATGNLLFSARARARSQVAGQLRKGLAPATGGPVDVFVRSPAELRELLRVDPFGAEVPSGATPYVTFLPDDRVAAPSEHDLPTSSAVEILLRRPREVLSWGRRIDGRPGFPNPYVERCLKSTATTRNWSTVLGLAEQLS